MSSPHADYRRVQAQWCRRLAAQADEPLAQELLTLAEEYESPPPVPEGD